MHPLLLLLQQQQQLLPLLLLLSPSRLLGQQSIAPLSFERMIASN